MVAAVEYSRHCVLYVTSYMLGTSVGGVWSTTGSEPASREVPPNANKTTNIITNSELQYRNAPKINYGMQTKSKNYQGGYMGRQGMP